MGDILAHDYCRNTVVALASIVALAQIQLCILLLVLGHTHHRCES
jgi:hypothetical protein